jgi:hypothetical protein
MQIGISLQSAVLQSDGIAGSGTPLADVPSLFTAEQTALTDTAHIDLRANWEVSQGELVPLNINSNDVRIFTQTPMTQGHPYVMTWDMAHGTSGSVKAQLGGAGVNSGRNRNADDDKPQLAYFAPGSVLGHYPRCGFSPNATFDARISNLRLYDLSLVDPHVVACDVVLCLGDSNMSNSTSDFVTTGNAQTPYDPRVWYLPCLRTTNPFNSLEVARHIPTPLIEPVASGAAMRMSPIAAISSRLVEWSASRGRPLIMLALADPGSGLRNTEDWKRNSDTVTTGSRMWNEMVAMLAALAALGPQHQIIGACVSLGANDTTGADYNAAMGWTAEAVQFIGDLRAELGQPTLPIVWNGCAEDYEMGTGPDYNPGGLGFRIGRMRAAQASLDAESGSPFATPGVRFVPSQGGNPLQSDNSTPDAFGFHGEAHFNAAGIQTNGRAMGDALLSMLQN